MKKMQGNLLMNICENSESNPFQIFACQLWQKVSFKIGTLYVTDFPFDRLYICSRQTLFKVEKREPD